MAGMTREELEKIYPRSEFPNEEAWRATIDTYLDSPGCCHDCAEFVYGPFSWDGVSFDGVCTKHKKIVPNRLFFPCPDGK